MPGIPEQSCLNQTLRREREFFPRGTLLWVVLENPEQDEFVALEENDRPLTNAQKEAIIAEALATDEGRRALAQAMVEPIRRSLEYQAIGRRLLMVDELPQGIGNCYEKSEEIYQNL